MADNGFVPWPEGFQQQYRQKQFWRGELLPCILEDRARENPDAPALVAGDSQLSYAEMLAAVNGLCHQLLGAGVAPGQNVVLHTPSGVEFYLLFFALLKLGVKPVLALESHRLTEIRYFCQHAEANFYLSSFSGNDCVYRDIAVQLQKENVIVKALDIAWSDERGGTRCKDIRGESLVRDANAGGVGINEAGIGKNHTDCVRMEKTLDARIKVKSDAVAFYLLSGGTTGTPKLIARTHDDYFYSVRVSAEVCELSSSSVYLLVMPASHNFTLSSPGALGVMFVGGLVVVAKAPDPASAFQLIEQHRVSMVALVPPLAATWVNALEQLRARGGDVLLDSLKLIQVGGAKLSLSLAEKIQPLFDCRLQQVFGMAEGLVNYTRVDDSDDIVLETQGSPMSPADEIRVLDDNDQPVAPGVPGHLLTRGPYTIRGYYRAPEHNARAFTADGFYRTGDIVALTENGYLIVTGRSKDQINRGGEKISAEEVENCVLAHNAVIDCSVVAMPDVFLGERVCAFVVPTSAAENQSTPIALKREILAYLRTLGIAAFKIPDRIELVSALPITQFGKVDKNRLRKIVAEINKPAMASA